MTSAIGGPAATVYPVTSRQGVVGRDAVRAVVVTDGRAAEGGPAQAVYYVSDAEIAAGEFVISGNPPIPIVEVGASGVEYPAIAVYADDRPIVVPSDPIGDALRADAVAYWKMDETSGARVDATGNGYDLLDVNNVSSDTGKVGNAGSWDGDTKYLHSADSVFNVVDTSFTFSLWVYLSSVDRNLFFISKEDEVSFADPYVLAFDTNDDRLEFWISDGVDYPFVKADNIGLPDTNTWYFVIGWYDMLTQTVNIQANNGTIYSLETSISPASNDNDFNIGGVLDGSDVLHGMLDEVGFWKRVLTSDERIYLYNSGAGRTLYP